MATEKEDTVGQYDIPHGTEVWDVPLNANLDAIDNRITVTESTNTTQSGQIATLQGQVATNTSDISTANANIATNTTNIAANTGNITTNTSSISSLNASVSSISSTLTTTTATANAAVPKDTLVINVKDHGAVGNGAADDTSAINTAIGVLASGGVVYFPPGNYVVNSATVITLPANVVLRGAGPGASTITIGASFSGAQAINVTGINAGLEGLTIRGASSTTTSNPVAFGVASVNNQNLRIHNCAFRFINGYAIKAWGDTTTTTAGGTTLHGGTITSTSIESCAGGIHIKTTNGGSISNVWPANFRITDLYSRSNGVSTGGSANLDCVRIEDSGDIIMENVFIWMGQTSAGTGVALRVVGKCAATFITNLDALGPVTGPNVSIEGNANGSPQNVQITGGVIQQGSVGINIQDAATQVRLVSMRILNNQTHGATVSTTGPAIYFDGCFFSVNGQGATGSNYDLNWSGTTTGFVTNCRFASPIVTIGTAGVQQSVNITAGQNVRFFDADFQGTGAAQANWFTALPAAAHTVTGGNNAFLTNTDFNYATGPGRVSIQPFAAGNNCLALNVQGTDTNDRYRLTGDGAVNIGPGNAARDTQWGRQGVANIGTTNSDISINLAGKTLKVQSGTNAKAGTTAAMTAGSVTVSTTAITASSVVVASLKTAGGTVGAPFVSAVTPGTSFTLKSTSGTDTSVYNWIILEVI